MSGDLDEGSSGLLAGKRVAFLGRLASMPRREAAQLVRAHGATVVEKPDAACDLAIVGENAFPLPEGSELEDLFEGPARQAIDEGRLEVVTESGLWQRLGLVDTQHEIHRLYTPAMLADLLHVSVAVIRRWHRRGLIVPVREVRRLPYFDFQEVATARRLAEMLSSGMSPAAIEKKLAGLARYVPGVERPLAQLSVIIEGRDILLRQGEGLVEPGGQLRFDFDAAEESAQPEAPRRGTSPGELARHSLSAEAAEPSLDAPAMLALAAELEDEGHLEQSAEMVRAAMVAQGPQAELCFQLAELLYRQGDLAAARERYYMAVELDEDYVEARANLGCVLAELGQRDLAIAALQGALAFHGDYGDAHYHLARLLDQAGRGPEAQTHWEAFLGLAPDSPWADQARQRLGHDEP
jgi:tetratricopeptide (TPR) repeat protein